VAPICGAVTKFNKQDRLARVYNRFVSKARLCEEGEGLPAAANSVLCLAASDSGPGRILRKVGHRGATIAKKRRHAEHA
jgi:hypothetical protein